MVTGRLLYASCQTAHRRELCSLALHFNISYSRSAVRLAVTIVLWFDTVRQVNSPSVYLLLVSHPTVLHLFDYPDDSKASRCIDPYVHPTTHLTDIRYNAVSSRIVMWACEGWLWKYFCILEIQLIPDFAKCASYTYFEKCGGARFLVIVQYLGPLFMYEGLNFQNVHALRVSAYKYRIWIRSAVYWISV